MSDISSDDSLEAGLAAGFGGQGLTVLHAIERSARISAPRIHLRDAAPRDGRPPEGERDARAPSWPLGASGPTVAGRANYTLQGEIARGGMGVLLKGRDLDLGRDVALKVLREDLAARPEIVRRFVEEAQIGGQLQHPGIVPVYELGVMADQRPYFAMKLVKGRTLAALIADRRPADRRKMLDVFASVCQTLAYAHSRGVVHRDLKPANVLIGAFGEVQVIDWGLAKVLGENREARETPRETDDRPSSGYLETVRSGTVSIAGAVMGTPAYMSPEQARGEVESIDERADVFALGATLCEILTGDPPYRGDTKQTMLQASRADLGDARERLNRCDADAELLELCRACLAPDPAQRPRSAEAVNERVQAYLASLAERVRAAELHAAEARVRARSTAQLSAFGIAVALAAAALWIGWRETRSRELQQVERNVGADLTELGIARAERDWSRAAAAAERARARVEGQPALTELSAQVETLLAQVQADSRREREREERSSSNRELFAALEEVRQPEGDKVYPTDWATLDRAYAAAFAAHGLEVERGAAEALAQALELRGVSVELAGALDEWASVRRRAEQPEGAARLSAVARSLDPDALRQRLREALVAGDVAALREIAAQFPVRGSSAPTAWLLGHALVQAAQFELALPLLAAARREFPQDYKLAMELARALRVVVPTRSEEAVEHYQAALALRPDRVAVWHDLAQTLIEVGRTEDALAVFRRAGELAPDDAHLQQHVGNALNRLLRFDEAVVAFEHALALDPSAAPAHVDYGLALGALGRRDEQFEHFERAVELAPDYADAHAHLGVARAQTGRFHEALAATDKALELAPKMGKAHFWRGYSLAQLGRNEEATAAYRSSLELEPTRVDTHVFLGIALLAQGLGAEAVAVLETGLRLAPDDQRLLGWLASVYTHQADLPPGGPERALAPARRLTEVHPSFDTGHEMLAIALIASGELLAARDALGRAVELGGETPLRAFLAGLCFARSGDAAAAHEALLRAQPELDALREKHPPLRAWIDEAQALLAQ
jgi:serine/threonine protein kinase/Flp pilus assembly protein TadD